MKMKTNLNDDNAKQCKKGNNNAILIYENKYNSKII